MSDSTLRAVTTMGVRQAAVAAGAVCALVLACVDALDASAPRPHFVFILQDDLGELAMHSSACKSVQLYAQGRAVGVALVLKLLASVFSSQALTTSDSTIRRACRTRKPLHHWPKKGWF